jgi:hypothetical protein
MNRLLMLLMLIILGTMAVRTQQPSPYVTNGALNGLAWRADSLQERMSYLEGASDGYIFAAFARACSAKEALPSWFRTDLTGRIIMHEMHGHLLRRWSQHLHTNDKRI